MPTVFSVAARFGEFCPSFLQPSLRRCYLSNTIKRSLMLHRSFAPSFGNYPPRYRSDRQVRDYAIFQGSAGLVPLIMNGYRLGFKVELRDPMFDRRVLELCCGFPPEAFRGLEGDRLLVREGLKSYLPNAILNRRSRGTQCSAWYFSFRRAQKSHFELIAYLNQSDRARSLFDLPRLSADVYNLLRQSERALPTGHDHALARTVSWAYFLRWWERDRTRMKNLAEKSVFAPVLASYAAGT